MIVKFIAKSKLFDDILKLPSAFYTSMFIFSMVVLKINLIFLLLDFTTASSHF